MFEGSTELVKEWVFEKYIWILKNYKLWKYLKARLFYIIINETKGWTEAPKQPKNQLKRVFVCHGFIAGMLWIRAFKPCFDPNVFFYIQKLWSKWMKDVEWNLIPISWHLYVCTTKNYFIFHLPIYYVIWTKDSLHTTLLYLEIKTFWRYNVYRYSITLCKLINPNGFKLTGKTLALKCKQKIIICQEVPFHLF